jgi:hypothetical protein
MRKIFSFALFALASPNVLAATADFDLQIENAVQVSFAAETGKLYQIESSPDVKPAVWTVEGKTIEGRGQRYLQTFLTGADRRVYRIQQVDITTGLVGYYPFNGNANDASGSGNDAVVSGAELSPNRFGQNGKAYSFDATGELIQTTNAVGFPVGTADLTVSMWVNASQRTDFEHGILFSNFAADEFQLDVYWTAPAKAQVHFHTGGLAVQGPPDCATTDVEWQLDRWYNIQIIRSGNILRIYRDQALLAENETTQGNNAPPDLQNLEFGFRTPNAGHQFYGAIDDIRVYARALSVHDLKALNDAIE